MKFAQDSRSVVARPLERTARASLRTIPRMAVLLAVLGGACPARAQDDLEEAREFLPEGALLRLGTSRWRQGTRVLALAMSPDGASVLSGTADGLVTQWEFPSGRERRTLSGHTQEVTSVAFSADGTRAVSASRDKTVRLWDLSSGVSLSVFEGHGGPVTSVAISQDGHRIVSGSEDCTAVLWDIQTKSALRTFEGRSSPVRSVALSSDGSRLLSGSSEGIVTLWDTATGKVEKMLQGHARGITAVLLTRDGRTALSSSLDRHVIVWDLHTGKARRRFGPEHFPYDSAGPGYLALSPDERSVLSDWPNYASVQWRLDTGEILSTPGGHYDQVTGAAFSPDGNRLITCSRNRTLHVYPTGKENTSLEIDPQVGEIVSLVWVAGEPILSLSNGRRLVSWDPLSGRRTGISYNLGQTRSMAPGGAAQSVLLGSDNRFVNRISTRTLRRTSGFLTRGPVWAMTSTIDGTMVYCADQAGQFSARRGDTGRLLADFSGHRLPVVTIALSSDGGSLASGSLDGTIGLWNPSTGERLVTLEGHGGPVRRVAFLENPRFVLSGSDDQTLRLWDTKTRAAVRVFQGHEAPVTDLAVSPDGQTVVSTSRDKTLRIWNLRTGTCMRVLRGHRGPVLTGVWSPGGAKIASGSTDTMIYLWAAAPPEGGAARCSAWADEWRSVQEPTRTKMVESLAADLGSDDPERGFVALSRIRALGEEGISTLVNLFQASSGAPDLGEQDWAALIRRLDRDSSTDLAAVRTEIRAVGGSAFRRLRKRLEDPAGVSRPAQDVFRAALDEWDSAPCRTSSAELSRLRMVLALAELLPSVAARTAIERARDAFSAEAAGQVAARLLAGSDPGSRPVAPDPPPLVRDALETLEKEPADPLTNLVAGKYTAFQKSDWTKGLAMLAKGDDRGLRELARKDLSGAERAEGCEALGDAWWGQAERSIDRVERPASFRRARTWYDRARTASPSPDKKRLHARLLPSAETPWPEGREIDLLALVDPQRDAVEGAWLISESALENVGRHQWLRIQIPYIPPEEYDLILDVVRKEGVESVNVGISNGVTQATLLVDGWPQEGFYTGLMLIDGHWPVENRTATTGRRLTNGSSSTIRCSVRKDGIEASVDGKPAIHWKGSLERMSTLEELDMPDMRTLFIHSYQCIYQVRKMVLRPVSGLGEKLR